MRIGTMLTLGFGVVIMLMIIIVATTHWRVSGFAASINEIHQEIYPSTIAAATIRFNVVKNWANTQSLSTITNKDAIQRLEREMQANSKRISENFDVLTRTLQSEDEKKLVAAALAARDTYTQQRKEFLAMLKDEDREPAHLFLVGPLKSSLESYLDSIGKIFAALSVRLEEETAASDTGASRTRTLNMLLGLIALVVAGASAVTMVRTLSGQLGGEVFAASDAARAIAAGNLAVDIEVRGGDSASLMASLQSMRDKLRAMAMEIQASAQRVADAARNVSRASDEVATASANQADATGAAAASVEELTVSINHLADNADAAHTFSRQSAELSQNGEAVIRDAGAEMEKISHSVQSSSGIIAELEHHSQEISAVVNVIKEIADQTNLLALNAAIEAARAGEQGRGCAVVADEVRKLAECTTASTQEIAVTIQKIQSGTQAAVQSMVSGVDQVKTGTQMAQQAGAAIGEIQSAATHVLDVVNDISSSLKEQSSTSNEISRSIERIAQMVTTNNTASKDVAAAAAEMEQLADGLTTSVKFFKL